MKAIFILSFILIIGFVSAVPQVIFSDINVSIYSTVTGNTTTGNYRLLSEGLDASTNFGIDGNCTFNYSRTGIPITFSRDIIQNDTDMATLIHALTINNNITQQWQECNQNLSICMDDTGYKGNYTVAKDQLDICYRARDQYSTQINDLNSQINNLTTWRNLGVLLGIIGMGGFIYLWRKQQIKTAIDPYKTIPSVGRQY
jgi:hypothetical protein